MSPASKDARCRQDVIFSMDLAISVFTPRSYSIIARKKEFKKFVMGLAKEQPDIMRQFLSKVLKDIPESAEYPENIVGGKRSAEDIENSREAKKAKLEKTRCFVKSTFRCERDGKDLPFVALGAQDEEDQSDSYDGARDYKTTYTPYEIEFGLTHGESRIHSMFATKFATIPHSDSKDGSRVFEICKNFKFEQVSASLIKFFRTPTRAAPIPLSCDVQDPSEILRILRRIDRFIQEPKTHKAFAQMSLFTTIDRKVEEGRYSDYQHFIDKLARIDVGSDISKDITEKVIEYRADYHRGRKWLEISESFGGTGIVFIIIVIGLGSWKFCNDLTDFERTCLGIVASHLPSIRIIVDCLGDSALEDYCRHGSLSEVKINDLEKLTGLTPDADDSSDHEPDAENNGDHESEEERE